MNSCSARRMCMSIKGVNADFCVFERRNSIGRFSISCKLQNRYCELCFVDAMCAVCLRVKVSEGEKVAGQ